MKQKTLLKSVGLFIVAYLVLLTLSLQFGNAYTGFLLPLYHWEFGQLTSDYLIQSLMLGDSHGESVVAMSLLTKYFVIGNRVISSGISISCSTLAGHAFQHPLLILSFVIAWPAATVMQKIVQVCCALPFLLLVELLDVPLILLGSAQDIVIANFAPENDSLLVGWMNFLNGGGRPALSLFAAMLAVVCSRFFSDGRRQQSDHANT